MKRILVTGATGFIGRYVVNILVKRGYQVHAISRTEHIESGSAIWHKADLKNSFATETVFQRVRPSHLLHLAWDVEHTSYMTSFENFQWVSAGLDVLRFFHQNGGERAVFVGTCAEYDWNYGYLSEDITPCTPTSNYGICKNALHTLADAFCSASGIRFAWGRVFLLYGPHEPEERLVASTIKSILLGRHALCTPGEQYRDYMYVEDVANALCALLESSVDGVVNIASGEPRKVCEVVQLIADYLESPELVKLGAMESRPGEPQFMCGNNEKLLTKVKWKPQYTLEEGIKATIQWWENRLAGNRR